MSPERGAGPRSAWILPLALLCATAGAWWPLAWWDPSDVSRVFPGGVEGWLFSTTAAPPWLVYGVGGWLLWRRRRAFAATLGSGATPGLALAIAVSTALIYVWSVLTASPHLLLLSLVTALWCGAATLGGPRACRVVSLPAVVLMLAIPLPGVVINETVEALQAATGASAAAILDLVGVENLREGHLIHARERLFHVIETCSGLRAVETLTLTAVVYWEIFKRSRLQLVVLVVAAPAIAYVLNTLRVTSIILVPASEYAEVHTLQGMIALFLGVLSLGALDRGLAGLEPARAHGGEAAHHPPEADPTRRESAGAVWPTARVLALVGLGAGLGLANVALKPWPAALQAGNKGSLAWHPRDVQHALNVSGGWKSQRLEIDRSFQGSVHFTERIYRSFRRGDVEVELFVGLEDRGRLVLSGRSSRMARPGPSWDVVGREALPELPDLPEDAQLLRLRSARGEMLVLWWTQGDRGFVREALRALLALDRSPWRRSEPLVVVRAAVPIERAGTGSERARRALRSFAKDLVPAIARLQQASGPAALYDPPPDASVTLRPS